MSLISISGFIALISYIVTLLPSNLSSVFPITKKQTIIKIIRKYRRDIGLSSFLFASIHASITISHLHLDMMNVRTYAVYYSGITTLVIFTLLAITSNRFSIRRMKKAWKFLHNFTYLAMFLLIVHIWSLMLGKWTSFTGIGLMLLGLVIILYLIRIYVSFWKKTYWMLVHKRSLF